MCSIREGVAWSGPRACRPPSFQQPISTLGCESVAQYLSEEHVSPSAAFLHWPASHEKSPLQNVYGTYHFSHQPHWPSVVSAPPGSNGEKSRVEYLLQVASPLQQLHSWQ